MRRSYRDRCDASTRLHQHLRDHFLVAHQSCRAAKGSGRLALAQQRRGTVPFQPLSGGTHLIANQLSPHEVHFALVDRAQKVLRAWRVTGRTQLALAPGTLTPAIVAGDLVVQLDVSRQAKGAFLWEHQVLRLTSSGSRASFSLDAKAVCCNDGTGAVTPLRIASEGRLYQLHTNPKTGVQINRYSLGRP